MSDVRLVDLYTALPYDLPVDWQPDDDRLDRLASLLKPSTSIGLSTDEQWRMRTRLASSRYFLLRNVWNWSSGARGRTGVVETYFTLGGIERPFNGIDRIYATLTDGLALDGDVAKRLIESAWKLGAIEPITPARARSLALRILAKTGVDLFPSFWRKNGSMP